MKEEKKTCPVCGRTFIDRHIWGTEKKYCNLLCAKYAAGDRSVSLEQLREWANTTDEEREAMRAEVKQKMASVWPS